MNADWQEYYIDEIKADEPSSIAIGPFGSRMKSDCYVESGVRVVRGTNITSGMEFSGEFVFVTSDKAAELGGANLEPFDLVFPHRGAIGEVGIVPDDGKRYVLSSSLMKLRCDRKKADPQFIFYFFKSAAGRFELLKNASQVGTPGIGQPLTSLKGIRLKIPIIGEQQRIARVLGALDDRITLLRETNATLEAIAQALFKSWFVDFDPVHANAGTRPATLPTEMQALFPSTFTETAQGLVPEGWTLAKVEDLLELAYGKALKAVDRSVGDVPVYGSGGITGWHNQALVNKPSVIVGRKGTVGSLYWEDRPFFPIDTVFYVKSENPLTYCFYLLKTLGLEDMNTDGAVPGLNRNNVYRLPVMIPPEGVVRAFDSKVMAIREKIKSNLEHAQTLDTLRDTLLPRLISGQLRLPEIEVELCKEQL